MRSISDAVGSHLIHHRSTVVGAVLVGGMSFRFGSNKALFIVHGKPMGRVIADILRTADINQVFAVGDSQATADSLGLSFVADSFPGEGPLGGLLSAMHEVSTGILCVLPCDVPKVKASRVRQLVDAVTDSQETDVAVLITSREHWLCSAWQVKTCLPVLEQFFASGERAIHRAVGSLAIRRVIASDAEMINVNTLQQALEIERRDTPEVGD